MCSNQSCAGATEEIEHHIATLAAVLDGPFSQRQRLLRRMFVFLSAVARNLPQRRFIGRPVPVMRCAICFPALEAKLSLLIEVAIADRVTFLGHVITQEMCALGEVSMVCMGPNWRWPFYR